MSEFRVSQIVGREFFGEDWSAVLDKVGRDSVEVAKKGPEIGERLAQAGITVKPARVISSIDTTVDPYFLIEVEYGEFKIYSQAPYEDGNEKGLKRNVWISKTLSAEEYNIRSGLEVLGLQTGNQETNERRLSLKQQDAKSAKQALIKVSTELTKALDTPDQI